MLASYESLELLLAKNPAPSLFAYGSNSPLKDVIETSIDKKYRIEISNLETFYPYMNDKEIIENTSILEKFSTLNVKTLFLSNVTSDSLIKTAEQYDIKVITVDSGLQDKFEDKIFFHNLLEANDIAVPKGKVCNTISDVKKDFKFPYVVQDPSSYGSLGTYIIKTENDLTRIPLQCPDTGWLVREYIDGLAYGVTFLIGKSNALVSQIRLQCSLNEYFDRGGGFFFGIQWINFNSLSLELIKNLESTFQKLIAVMQQANFTGIANVDFMISGSDVYVIECNPRLSGATWHLANRPELLHGKDFVQEYINVCLHGEVSENILTLPKSNYEGCTLDADSLELNFPVRNPKRVSIANAGVYNLDSDRLIKCSSNTKNWKENTYFCLPGCPTGQVLSSEKGIGVLLSHEPFYQYDNNTVFLNEFGKTMWQTIAGIFL